jgi:hypothetical protein
MFSNTYGLFKNCLVFLIFVASDRPEQYDHLIANDRPQTTLMV